MPKKKIAILGTGAAARYVSYILGYGDSWDIAGFIDKDQEKIHGEFCGKPVLGDDEILPSLPDKGINHVIIGIGNPQLRTKLANTCKNAGLILATAVHPSAILSPAVEIGPGVVIEAGSVLSDNPILEDNVWIGLAVTVCHDTRIGANSTMGGGSVVGAYVTIGEEVMVGSGAIIQPGKHIGNSSIVGSGANVVHDVPENAVVIGNPAKVIKERTKG